MMDRSILIVDDDPLIRATVAEILDFEGYPIRTAANGAEALAEIEREPPGVILMDMRMPVVDGWDLARALRNRGVDLPLIVMTAARSARLWAEEVGADAYLAKPFEIDELIETIDRLRSKRPPDRAWTN